MKRKYLVTVALVLSLLYGCGSPAPLPTATLPPPTATQAIPTETVPANTATQVPPTETATPRPPATGNDAKATCTVTTNGAPAFETWFEDGSITANGKVKPADSLHFNSDPNNCTFYQWSEQMFLWLTSPSDDQQGSHVFDSSTFYVVSPDPTASEKRSFIANIADKNPFNLPVRAKGDVIDASVNQAVGDGVLMSQSGSLVYYIIAVNDVFAYFVTGTANKVSPFPTQFPISQPELEQITNFAATKGQTVTDANTLTMEIKTSWVEVDKLPAWADPKTYITIEATIPTFNESLTLWTPKGKTTTTLALVGMHVVGSVFGHPEMSWATFEHKNNAPNAAYTYLNPMSTPVAVNQNTAGDWLLAASNLPTQTVFNQQHMKFDTGSGNIIPVKNKAKTPYPISANDTIRSKAWGSASDTIKPNPVNANTDIISINNDVLGMLASGDLRSNYIMIGATWTDGKAPIPLTTPDSNQFGAIHLSNTTMETFHQNATTGDITIGQKVGVFNCFACHSTVDLKGGVAQVNYSHVFADLLFNPLWLFTPGLTPTPTP